MQYKPIDITCAECGGCAHFEEPFAFFSSAAPPVDETRPMHRWGGWIVVERFPTQFSWVAPATSGQFLRVGAPNENAGGYPVLEHGLVRCGACHAQYRHRLEWPSDAYWHWQIRGHSLWAWDREHALAIVDYVGQTHRAVRRSPRMRYIPSFFFGAKVREEVVRAMQQRLAGR